MLRSSYVLFCQGLCVLPGFGVFLGFLVGRGFGADVLLDDTPDVLVGLTIIIVAVGDGEGVVVSVTAVGVSSGLTGRSGISAM